MSLPKFETQGSLFESLGSLAANLFSDQDRYKLFATKIWPLLARRREELAGCYVLDNGRPSVEPVVVLGVLIFQFLERVPDRQAAELVKYHLGWKLALNLDLNFKGIHHTTLSYFRERLLEKGKADLAMRIVTEGLQQAGLLKKRGKQRLDSTHIIGAVARLSALECVRETLALALEELQPQLKSDQLPAFWAVLWKRYVESKLDYKSSEETLRAKQRQAGDEGYGHQLMDRMAEEGYYLKRVNNGAAASKPNLYANLGAEWWSVVGELVEHRKVVLAVDEKLVAQLTSRRKLYDSKGREKLESKADMRARGLESPDRAGAIVGAIMLNAPGQSGGITARELSGIGFDARGVLFTGVVSFEEFPDEGKGDNYDV